MKDVDEILLELSMLELCTYPAKRIEELLRTLGKFGTIITKLGPGKTIQRGRLRTVKNERLTYVSDFSFNPNISNKYLRASTPNNAMFYGTYLPEKQEPNEPQDEKITLIYEIYEMARNKDSINEQKILFGYWEVLEEIKMVSVFDYEYYRNPLKIATELSKSYKDYISKYPELEKNSSEISKYLASEFAKENIQSDFDYMISAIYSEIVTEMGFDGIVYPSVRMEGAGINIALTRNAADNKLAFYYASEHTIIKNKLKMILSNEKYGIPNTHNSIDYREFPSKDLFTIEQAKKKVGL